MMQVLPVWRMHVPKQSHRSVTQAEDSEIYSVENVIHPLNNWCLENNIPFLGNDAGFARLKDARTKAEP